MDRKEPPIQIDGAYVICFVVLCQHHQNSEQVPNGRVSSPNNLAYPRLPEPLSQKILHFVEGKPMPPLLGLLSLSIQKQRMKGLICFIVIKIGE